MKKTEMKKTVDEKLVEIQKTIRLLISQIEDCEAEDMIVSYDELVRDDKRIDQAFEDWKRIFGE